MASVSNRNRAGSRAGPAHTSAVMTAKSTAVCDQQAHRAHPGGLPGVLRLGARLTGGRCPPESWRTTIRRSRRPARSPAAGTVDACGPKSPDSHRVVWGLTSLPPVHPVGFPPVSRLPAGFVPFARRPPVSPRPAFSGSLPSAVARFRFPSVSLRIPFPLSNLHLSAAARRFPRRWSRAAGTNATSSTTPLGSRDPPARRMGSGWARWDAATESHVTSGRERRTSPRPNCPDRPLLTRTCGLSPVRNVT